MTAYVLPAILISLIVILVLILINNAGLSRDYYTALTELANEFDTVMLVDLDKNKSKHFRVNDSVPDLLKKKVENDFFGGMEEFLNTVIAPEDRQSLQGVFNRGYLITRLNDSKYFFITYVVNVSETYNPHYETKMMRYGDWGHSHKIVLAGRCIDERLHDEENIRLRLEDSVEARTAELREKNDSLNRINDEIISLLGDLVEARDVESGEHVRRVRGFTHILTEQLMKDYPEYGLTKEDLDLITSASALHDLGKIMIPDSILLKPGKLTPEEFEIMKTHSIRGCDILAHAPKAWSEAYLKTSYDIVRYHHEKYDGKGYPEGLCGEDIPIAAQLVSIVDCYDALINKRCYKDAYSLGEAFDMIINGECGVFSEKILSCFKKCREKFEAHALDKDSFFITNAAVTADNDSMSGISLLLVDDDEMTREINAEILESSGATVAKAESGEQAIEIFKNSPKGAFDAILMDILMPGMDGFEATEKIRAIDNMGADIIPIIAVSTSHDEDYISKATEVGMNAYLFKPLIVSQLAKALVNSMRSQSQALQKKLTKTSRVANRDPLTGVRSMSAYTDKVDELKSYIESKTSGFAIVECDLNGLKNVNDTYGHDIGDVYIVNGCKMICNVFKHSPVYRIGGDEFVAVLQGIDYETRDILLLELKKKVEEALQNPDAIHGRVSMAAGMAEFIPGTDKSVGDVLKRADSSMYNNKKMMHMTMYDC